ncbi:GNAT family N-acetyltransferase [Acidicapsa acidisoli]|uniref:GNAT family N-acetyltransferase n=1 Tax=Acidicapsa acidisoli TaxID=1615681 RepID=UPI0021DF945C|nr:GNAT family N-acetyltransferase [Acidicapsa acidisoli]
MSHLDPHRDPGTGLTIRSMVESDIDSVMMIASLLPTAPQWSRGAYETAISADGIPKRIALAAEYSGELKGFVIARFLYSLAEIETLGVDVSAQRNGIGTSLLVAALDELRLAGVDEVELEVRPSNERAWRLYERIGFSEVGRRRGYYREPVEDAILLRLGLARQAFPQGLKPR